MNNREPVLPFIAFAKELFETVSFWARLPRMRARFIPISAIAFFALLIASPGEAAEPPSPKGIPTSVRDGWVTIIPPAFQGAINNPLKGFRDYKPNGFGLIKRQYVRWNEIELGAEDSVDRIIAHTKKITEWKGKRFEDLNIKLVPRVYLDWNGTPGKQHWPADLHAFDYDSPMFQERLKRLVMKLGQAWDEDPRIFAVQMGLIGHWGEHHHPAPTTAQRRLLTDAFKQAFKNKPVLVRHTDPEFMEAGFGIYYDTFANLSREPPTGPRDQFPWQATHVFRDQWKQAPIEGEVEYNWQKERENAKPQETFGRTPDETMTSPDYRRYMIDKIRRYHASYLGWIDNYDDSNSEVLAGAAELQRVFGYRFTLESASYPLTVQPGGTLGAKLVVRNTGSAPFYLDWPVAIGLLDPATKNPIWSAVLQGVDIRQWLPGTGWDSSAFAYRNVAISYPTEGQANLPRDLKPGSYIVALAILDRQGGMLPSARFAIENYFRGGWHPLGFIGVGEPPKQLALDPATFDSPAFDNSLHYKVPEHLLAAKPPPALPVHAVTPWTPNPKVELINPWRYWTISGNGKDLVKEIRSDPSIDASGPRQVLRVRGDFGERSSLNYTLGVGIRLEPGRYAFTFLARGTEGHEVEFELADGWRRVSREAGFSLNGRWTEQRVEFVIQNPFKEETALRFALPRNVNGFFEFTETHLKLMD